MDRLSPLPEPGPRTRTPALDNFSLIASCESNGVNPIDYLADVLLRVQSHPASPIDELLPHN